MTDEELVALLRSCSSDEAMWSREAADRIEALKNTHWQVEAMQQNALLHDALTRAENAEAKLAKAVDALKECQEVIDHYSWQEYPADHPVHERYRKRDFDSNPARIALAEIEPITQEGSKN